MSLLTAPLLWLIPQLGFELEVRGVSASPSVLATCRAIEAQGTAWIARGPNDLGVIVVGPGHPVSHGSLLEIEGRIARRLLDGLTVDMVVVARTSSRELKIVLMDKAFSLGVPHFSEPNDVPDWFNGIAVCIPPSPPGLRWSSPVLAIPLG